MVLLPPLSLSFTRLFCCLYSTLGSVSFIPVPCGLRTVDIYALVTPPKHLSSPSLSIEKPYAHCLFWKAFRRAKMLLINSTWWVVVLNYTLNRHTEYVWQIIYIFCHMGSHKWKALTVGYTMYQNSWAIWVISPTWYSRMQSYTIIVRLHRSKTAIVTSCYGSLSSYGCDKPINTQ